MTKKILLISYNFPPYPGIGGRRWAKFAKYLQRNGHDLHVISSENPFKTSSGWTEDVDGLKVHQLPLNYPSALITYPGGLWGKIRYRTSLLWVKAASNKNYYDRALFWEKQLVEKSSQLISEHGINNVIVTGAPFHLLYHSTRLKEIFPQINLVIDFRDYWTEDNSLFHSGSLSGRRIAEERKMEKFVLEKADKITAVANAMTDHFNQQTGSTKCSTILNGYDEDDFKFLEKKTRMKNDKLTFVFTGNLYKNIENVFAPFCEALASIKNDQPALYSKLQFDFFGAYPPEYKVMVDNKKLDCIRFCKQIPLKKTLEHIFHADYCMLFLNNMYTFSLSTKFCEYLGLRKKVILFSKQGISSDFIIRNKLGYWIDPDNSLQDLLAVFNNAGTEFPAQYSPDFDPEQFSIKKITAKIEGLLV